MAYESILLPLVSAFMMRQWNHILQHKRPSDKVIGRKGLKSNAVVVNNGLQGHPFYS